MQIPPRSVTTEEIPMPCQHKVDDNGHIIPDSAPLCEKAVITQGAQRIETVCLSIKHNSRSHTDTHTHEIKIFPWITRKKPKETDGKSGPGASTLFTDIDGGNKTSKRELKGNTKFISKLMKGKTEFPEHKQAGTDPKGEVEDKLSIQTPEKEPDGAWGGQDISIPTTGLTLEEIEMAGEDGLISTSGDFETSSPPSSPQLTFLPAEQRPARRTPLAQSAGTSGLETLLTDLGNLEMSTADFHDLHGGNEPLSLTKEELAKVQEEQEQQKDLQEKQRKKMERRFLVHALMTKNQKPDEPDSDPEDKQDSSEA